MQRQISVRRLFPNGEDLFKKGQISSSKQFFKTILSSHDIKLYPNLHYESLINLSTILLQLNETSQARKALKQAILIDQYRYEAFYNLILTNQLSHSYSQQSLLCLQQCLSLLYLKLGHLTDSLKFINKSISLNEDNPKAYLTRALFYEKNKKVKLAENQYENLTYENKFQSNPHIMMEIYFQKCLFYRRIKEMDKMQENLIMLNLLKKQSSQRVKKETSQKVRLILSIQQTTPLYEPELKQKILNSLSETRDLIQQITKEIQKNNKKIQNLQKDQSSLLSGPQQSNTKVIQIKQPYHFQKLTRSQENIDILEPTKTGLQTHNNEQLLTQQIQHEQYPSISINQDEDSAILNQKIEQLQRQIKLSGGNVPEVKDTSRNLQQENFLQYQIQKTISEINKKREEEQKNKHQQKLASSTHRSSLGDQIKSVVSNSQSDRRRSSFQDDNITIRSKISQSYEINLQEMKSYTAFQLEVRSVSMFDQSTRKKDSYLKIKYLEKQFVTQKCKSDKFTWNYNFEQQPIVHTTTQNYDETAYQLLVQLHAQEGGWLSWNKEVLLGTGTIKLTEKGTTKCTLQLNQEKVGMLYFKIKLKTNSGSQQTIKSPR